MIAFKVFLEHERTVREIGEEEEEEEEEKEDITEGIKEI